jgi:pimeloyl-ACP methyl ester carboxylesterase
MFLGSPGLGTRILRRRSPTSRETLLRAAGRAGAASISGVVVVVHGGQSLSTEPTSALQLSVLRMIPLAGAIRRAVRGTGVVVGRPRLRLRGWNGEDASPVHDLNELLDELSGRLGPVPVVLVGHSMGARAALRVAGHPLVRAAAGLAPWLPPGEPVAQLAGRRVLLVHGRADKVTSPSDTWAYADRARSVTQVEAIELPNGDHAMLRGDSASLRGPRLWHRIAAEFARASLGLSSDRT